MSGRAISLLGAVLIFLAFAVSRRSFRRLDNVHSPELLQLLIYACAGSGLILLIIGIVTVARR